MSELLIVNDRHHASNTCSVGRLRLNSTEAPIAGQTTLTISNTEVEPIARPNDMNPRVLVAAALMGATYLSFELTILVLDKFHYILAGARNLGRCPIWRISLKSA